MANSLDLRPDYDDGTDVLYLTLGLQEGGECEDTPDGVTLWFSEDDHKPVGAIVVGYEQYEWPYRIDSLSEIIGRHLSLTYSAVAEVLKHLRKRDARHDRLI